MVQSLDIPDLENILVKKATLSSEKISISQQQVFVTRLMRHGADGFVSLFVSALLVSSPFIWLSFPLWHLLSLTWMRCQSSIPLLWHQSHLLLPASFSAGAIPFSSSGIGKGIISVSVRNVWQAFLHEKKSQNYEQDQKHFFVVLFTLKLCDQFCIDFL